MDSQIKILLTGAEGYVGSLVFQQLEMLSRYSFMNPNLAPNIYVLPLYFLDQQSVDTLKKEKFDFIFHCAVIGGRSFDINDSSVFDKNIELFNLLKQLSFNKIIHFTSAADFGRNNDIFEEVPERVIKSNPLDFFGKAKKNICNEIINRNIGINLRVFNIYGQNLKKSQNFIDTVVDKLLQNEDIIIESDRYFDIFLIDNLRPIINKIISHEIFFDYNLVHKKKYKISDLVYFISKTLRSNSNIKIISQGNSYTGKNSFKLPEIDNIDPLDDLSSFVKSRIKLVAKF